MNLKPTLTVDQYSQICIALWDREQELMKRHVSFKLRGDMERAETSLKMHRTVLEALALLEGSRL